VSPVAERHADFGRRTEARWPNPHPGLSCRSHKALSACVKQESSEDYSEAFATQFFDSLKGPNSGGDVR
jgi:hypothetical protein